MEIEFGECMLCAPDTMRPVCMAKNPIKYNTVEQHGRHF